MKKNLIFFVLIAGLAAWAFMLFTKTQHQQEELTKAQTLKQEMETLQGENAELKQYRAQAANVEQARKDERELIKLRNEVSTLRTERQKLDGQLKQVTSMIEVMKANNVRLANVAQAAVPAQPVQADPTEMRNKCINNLRLMDGAKQQWALENKKTSEDTPTADDLLPYLGGKDKPWSVFCPAGGQYIINAVKDAPQCSVPGHVLP